MKINFVTSTKMFVDLILLIPKNSTTRTLLHQHFIDGIVFSHQSAAFQYLEGSLMMGCRVPKKQFGPPENSVFVEI